MSGRSSRVRGRKKRKQSGAEPAPSPPARRDFDQVQERLSGDSAATTPIVTPEGVAEYFQIAHRFEFSSGPLPHPDTFKGYEAVLPGAADRIFTMAETQLAHRHDQESAHLRVEMKLEGRGQWMAHAVALIVLLGGMVLLAFDKSLAGFATMIGAVAGIIGVLFSPRWRKARAAPPDSLRGESESQSHPPTITE